MRTPSLSLGLDLVFHPVTPDRWPDLERLFGPRGAYSGCWCMFWRLRRSEFDRSSADERRAGLKGLVDSGQIPGILAYSGDEPIAWVSLGPRETFPPLERSRTLVRVDEQPVWSIVCFFVAKPYRRQGLMIKLLRGAVAYAASRARRSSRGIRSIRPKGNASPAGWRATWGWPRPSARPGSWRSRGRPRSARSCDYTCPA